MTFGRVVLAVGILWALIPGVAQAASCTSTTSGSWGDSSIWSCGVVPGTGDSVTIATGHTVGDTVIEQADDIQVNGTLNAQSLFAQTVFVNSGGTLTLDGLLFGQTTVLTGGTINGTGSINDDAGLTNNGGTIAPTGSFKVFASDNVGLAPFTQTAGQTTISSGIFETGDIDLTGGSFTFNGGIAQCCPNGVTVGGTATMTIGTGANFNSGVEVTGGGTLNGGGTAGPLTLSGGTVAPGGSAIGTFTVSSFVQAGGSLAIDVTGPWPGTSDRLAVTGAASMGGELAVHQDPLLNTINTAFDVVTFGSRVGGFSSLTGANGLFLSYTANSARLGGSTKGGPPGGGPDTQILRPTIALSPNRKCRKSVNVKIIPPAGTTILRSLVTAGAKRINTKTTKGVVAAKIKLKKKTKISVAAITSAGATASVSKTYKRCK